MGKRSKQNFKRRERDFYGTIDPDATKPLIPFIRGLSVWEPCAGGGDLARLLESDTKIICESDIEPQHKYVQPGDALHISKDDTDRLNVDIFVTNPPFTWKLLQPLLDHLPTLRPTWLLLPADVAHNKRMGPYLKKCRSFVSVGRLYWVENKVKGVDNYVWFEFVDKEVETVFYGRN